jgi:hypothetical protein
LTVHTHIDLSRKPEGVLNIVAAGGFLPFVDVLNAPKKAAQVIARILNDTSVQTGVYYDQNGKPKLASPVARNPEFQDRVVAEARILLATVPA